MNSILNLSRREFLQAAGGLALGFYLPQSLAQSGPGKTVSTDLANAFSPNAFIRISPDNTVTVIVKHLEMGQGTYTGLPTLVAEELDADWSQIRAEGAPADAKRYNNLFWGEAQGTGGSTALANSYEQLRKAGAAARAMMVAAAAEQWQVPASEIKLPRELSLRKTKKRPSASLPRTPRSNPCPPM
jgi:isoquinoline 1-oxidoreductase beta subunit